MPAVLTLAVLLITLKALALQKTDPKSGPTAKDPQQALAMAALEAIDLYKAESEKLPRTPALVDADRQAQLAIEKLPRFVTLCGPPPPSWLGKVDPESGAKRYCAVVRMDLQGLLSTAGRVADSRIALALDPGNNDRKEELAGAIKEYQVLRAWLETRLKKWNLDKPEPIVPTKVTAVPVDGRQRETQPFIVVLDVGTDEKAAPGARRIVSSHPSRNMTIRSRVLERSEAYGQRKPCLFRDHAKALFLRP